MSIIDQQKEELLKRRKRIIKKSLTKSASVTMSVESMFDSPDKVERKVKKMDTFHLFESLIDSEL